MRRWRSPLLIFLGSSLLFGWIFQGLPVLYDTDSYYHLAIARAYARHGIIDTLPWAQLSLLHDFADKELLFHLALAPWADTSEATAGGRWALALFNGAIVALLAALGRSVAGRFGLLAPLLIYAGSLDYLGRMIRLRPEVLSLFLLVLATICAGKRRYRLLGVVTFVYTLSYTAFHALLGLCGLWFLTRIPNLRRADWGLLLYPLCGAGAGLVLHPHFPQNLVVWKVQSIDFFRWKGVLDVGTEIRPHPASELLGLNLVWLLAVPLVLCLVAQRDRSDGTQRRASDMLTVLWVATAVFGLLYLRMARFSTYFIPFATLALLATSASRPWSLPTALRRRSLTLVLVAVLAAGLFRSGSLLYGLASARGPVPREGEWAAFGAKLPPGATVAAEWGSTHLYMFWAPRAAFLNVLDPVFMVARYPEAYRALRGIFDGKDPDIPLTLRRDLLSDHIALSRYHRPEVVISRLANDPRLQLRHDGYTLLYEVVGGTTSDFVLDWTVIPKGQHLPPDPAAEIEGLAYTRQSAPELRELEAYVDASRAMIDDDRCVALAHRLSEPRATAYRFAPYGPSRVWLDDQLVATVDSSSFALLGEGHEVSITTTADHRQLVVLTCRPGPGEPAGFYLR